MSTPSLAPIPCDVLPWHSSVTWTSETLLIPATALVDPDMRLDVVLEVSTSDGRNATAWITVHTSNDLELQLAMLDGGFQGAAAHAAWSRSTPSTDLALRFTSNASPTVDDWTVTWLVTNEQGDDVTSYLDVRTNPAVSSPVFVLSTRSLDASHQYTYTATLSSIAAAQSASAQITVYHNAPPTSGVLFVEPKVGVAWETHFATESYGWTDEDLPLSYSFVYLLASDMNTAHQLAANGQAFFGRSKDTAAADYDLVTFAPADQRSFAQVTSTCGRVYACCPQHALCVLCVLCVRSFLRGFVRADYSASKLDQ